MTDINDAPIAGITIESWPQHYKGMQVGVPIGIKVTHGPSGLTATCDSERSMLANRTAALKLLLESPQYLEWLEANERARVEPNTGRSTHRREANKLAKGDTRFEDWP